MHDRLLPVAGKLITVPSFLPRAFLDANLLVALVLYDRGPHPLLSAALDRRYRPQWSAYVVQEARRMLRRALPGRLRELEALLRDLPHDDLPEPSAAAVQHCRGILGDDADVPVFAAAWEAGADYLVTSDRRLRQKARGHAPPEVVAVPEFLRILNSDAHRREES
ncbi:MAG: PIN domain-containing protein [Armatimonadetes bacterium]|nr:PIN domain-containing protein [Armatimonadota bacterium]